jgi:hypothetical protein
MKDIAFNFPEQIMRSIVKFSDDLSIDEVQCVFEEWITLLEWVIGNGGECFIT